MADFNSASEAMKAGSKARRKRWLVGDYCFKEKQCGRNYAMLHSARAQAARPHVFYWDDVTAKDWEIAASFTSSLQQNAL